MPSYKDMQDETRQSERDFADGYKAGCHDAADARADEDRSVLERATDAVVFGPLEAAVGAIVDAVIPTPDPSESYESGYQSGYHDEYQKGRSCDD